jgi:hypothetical protein
VAGSEQVERGTDLLGGVPGQLVPLGLVDDELRVVAAEVGLQDDVDVLADLIEQEVAELVRTS